MRLLSALLLISIALILPAHADEAVDNAELLMRKGKTPEDRVKGASDLVAIGTADALEAHFANLNSETDIDLCAQFGLTLEKLSNEQGFKYIVRMLPKWTEGRGLYVGFWVFCGLAKGKTAAGDELLKNAIDGHALNRAAAFEALAEVGRVDCDTWLIEHFKAYKKDPGSKEIIGILSALSAAPRLVDRDAPDSRNALMAAVLNVLALSTNDRIRYFASHALAALSGEKPYLDLEFWREWLKNKGSGAPPPPVEKRTGAKFFEAEAAGRKIVFCIDVSGSMNFKLKMDAKGGGPITRGQAGKDCPDYSGVTTRLELAKVELLWTLAHLPEDYSFNIVTYSKGHQLLEKETVGFVKANEKNKTKFANLVRALKADGGTNIHGGLLDSFKIIDKAMAEGDPGCDQKALFTGADTIFFLTDGHPSWSDDSEGKPTTIGGDPPQTLGTGKMANAENILKWAKLTNRFRKVVINTVGIGDHAKELMVDLAKLSFGVYIDRTGIG